jgi:RND family efflux transporter MFP subunit
VSPARRRILVSSLIAAAVVIAGGLLLRQRAAPAPQAPTAGARGAAPGAAGVAGGTIGNPVEGAGGIELALLPRDVFTLQQGELLRTLELNGSLKAVDSAVLKARAAGELQRLDVREGDSVHAGQEIGRIDPTEARLRLQQAEQQLVQTRAQLDIAQRQLDNNQALQRQGFISGTALQTSESNATAARAAVQAAQAALALARKATDDTVLRAPLTGLVSQRLAQPGERLALDARVLEIVDLRRLELEAGVPPDAAPALRPGQPARLQVEGAAEVLPARLARINPSAQAGSRQLPVYLSVDGHPSLRQGLFARVTLELDRRHALLLPVSALRNDQPQPYVVRVGADGLAQWVVPRLGERGRANGLDGVDMVVVLDGLTAGDRVLSGAAGLVPQGMRLRLEPPGGSPQGANGPAPSGPPRTPGMPATPPSATATATALAASR